MPTITIDVSDEEHAFIEGLRSVYRPSQDRPGLEQMLLQSGVIGYVRYLLTGSFFEDEDADYTWTKVADAIITGPKQWLEGIAASEQGGAESGRGHSMFG